MKRTILTIALQLILCIWMNAQNTNLGTDAGNAGYYNTSVGGLAGDVVTGSANSFFGYGSGSAVTSGGWNTFLGATSGAVMTTGESNVFCGYSSGNNSNGSSNVYIGYYSGNGVSTTNNTGYNNVFVGRNSGTNISSGYENTLIGYFSGSSITTGFYNTYLGTRAGVSGTTASRNTFLGYKSGYSNITGTDNVFIGYQVGYNETGSNKLYIDNSSTSTPLIYGDFTSNKVGINVLPNTTHTLTVGGTIHATGVFVNGVAISGDMSLWNRNGSNVNTDNVSDNIGIGVVLTSTNNPNNYKLAVKGKIGAQEVQIENTSITWSDFVFYDDYKLRSLEEVEAFIKTNGHLPEIPSEKQVKEEGIKLAEMNAKLLQKIEELTLYVIELKKEVDELKKAQE